MSTTKTKISLKKLVEDDEEDEAVEEAAPPSVKKKKVAAPPPPPVEEDDEEVDDEVAEEEPEEESEEVEEAEAPPPPVKKKVAPPVEAVDEYDYGMPVHAVAKMFPAMEGEAFEDLVADIKKHGLANPVIVHKGELLDGRNRIRACKEAGVEPVTKEWKEVYDGKMSVSDWIWSVNTSRRYLSKDQLIQIRVKLTDWEEVQAATKKKKNDNLLKGKVKPAPDPAKSPDWEKSNKNAKTAKKVTEIAAATEGTEYQVKKAMKIHEAGPALEDKVISGEVKSKDAVKSIKGPPAKANGNLSPVDRFVKCVTVIGQREWLEEEVSAVLEQTKDKKPTVHLFLKNVRAFRELRNAGKTNLAAVG